MKKFTHRLLPLALCFTLTLGTFAYRPPQAEAIAGVDDAVVIGALLSAFGCGVGLIFSNNGMTSDELAQGLTDKWAEYKATLERTPDNFADWLGYEDMDALLVDCKVKAGNALEIPKAMAQKFKEFTEWFVKDASLISAGSNSVLLPGSISLSNLTFTPDSSFTESFQNNFTYSLSNSSLRLESAVSSAVDSSLRGWLTSENVPVSVSGDYTFNFSGVESHFYKAAATSSPSVGFGYVGLVVKNADGKTLGSYKFAEDGKHDSFSGSHTVFIPAGSYFRLSLVVNSNLALSSQTFQWSGSVARSSSISFSVSNPAGVQTPDLAGDEAANPTLSGVGDGTATTIEDLLQQILEQLQANTLAPTLDVAGTETGGDTGTDEDSKPYLPYIPQIFEKIKDLPGTLSNIWETVKGIPAAIAEKVGALFKPDEALVTEIVDAFKGKFGFLSTLNSFVNDLFSLTPESDPPVIWVHLENAESKYGYSYGDKQKILDLSWYQKYKASVDGILSGFLWLGYLWLLFKRAPGILNGMSLADDDAPRSADMPDMLNIPRLGAGDGSTMYRGDGFTMRDKGRRGK